MKTAELQGTDGPAIPSLIGPPFKTLGDITGEQTYQDRRIALEEYNRTIREFRDRGRILPRKADSFEQGEPARRAHLQARRDVEAWREESVRLRQIEERSRKNAEAANAGNGGRTGEEDLNGLYTDETKAADTAVVSAAPSLPVTIRGEVFDPKARPVAYDGFGRARELDISRPAAFLRPPAGATDEDTQGWLNAILGECHFLMHEVMFRSICATDKLEDRLGLIRHSMDVAKTAAKVGKSIAELKRGQVVEARRKTTVEHVESVSVKGQAP